MIQTISEKGKLLGVLFFVSCCLLLDVGIGWGGDDVTFSSMTLTNDGVLPGDTIKTILAIQAHNNSVGTTISLSTMTVTSTGIPINMRDIDLMNLWRDTDTTWEKGASATEKNIDTHTVVGTPSQITFTPSSDSDIPFNTTVYFYVTYNLKTSDVTDLDTIGIEVSTDTHIELDKEDAVASDSTFPLNSTGKHTVTVEATRYAIDTIGEQMAGVAFEVTTRALDSDNNPDLNYSGATMTLSGNAGDAPCGTPPSYVSPGHSYLWKGTEEGVYIFTGVILYRAEGGVKLKVEGEWEANSDSFDVVTAWPNLIISEVDDPFVAGTSDSFTVEAKEPYGNSIDYNGTVCFTSTDDKADLPDDTTFISSTATISGLVLKTAGEQTVIATDKGNSSVNGSQTVIVTHSDLNSFTIDILEGVIYPGIPFEIRIRARDSYNNIVKSFSGTVNLSTNNSEILVTPAVSGNFAEGIWQGKVYLGDYGGNVGITCDDGEGHTGLSSMISMRTYEFAHKSMNYPNPFDPIKEKTTIQFYMRQGGKVKIKIYAPTRDLVNEWEIEGREGINTGFQWDGRDKDRNIVKSGTYFCLIKTDGEKDIIKITVLK